MLVREFEGKTEKEAIKIALETLNIEEDQIRIEPVKEGKVGFFGFRNKKPVKIKVYYEESQSDTFALKSKQYIEKLFNIMSIKAIVEIIEENDNKVFLSISSESSGLIIGKRGRTLESIQFMVNVTMNKGMEEWKKVILDIEGYWDKREEAIRKLSIKTASMVRATKKPKILDTMNPFERRLVHLTLQDFDDIGTKSEGEGTFKKVKIFLK